jgi:hypothetical protein
MVCHAILAGEELELCGKAAQAEEACQAQDLVL